MKRTRLSIAIGAGVALLDDLHSRGLGQTQAPDRVEITGSLLRRTDAETALPVAIIHSES